MNKNEFIARFAEDSGLTITDSKTVVEGVLETIQDVVVSGEEVNLTGFGKFEPHTSAARTGRNPRTGESVDIPAKKRVRFKVGTTFKNAVEAGE